MTDGAGALLFGCEPFETPFEALSWAYQNLAARHAGEGLYGPTLTRSGTPRPCEPIDVHQVVERLYHRGQLHRWDLEMIREAVFEGLTDRHVQSSRWQQALRLIEAHLVMKGIVRRAQPEEARDG